MKNRENLVLALLIASTENKGFFAYHLSNNETSWCRWIAEEDLWKTKKE